MRLLEVAVLVVGIVNIYIIKHQHVSVTLKQPPLVTSATSATSPTKQTTGACHRSEKHNVVSFALFNKNGDQGKFQEEEWLLTGLEANRLGWHFYFPDWVMRVYVGPGVPAHVLAQLKMVASDDPKFELVLNTPTHGTVNNFHQWMMHRFMVMDDTTVARFVVRDLDGRPSMREVLALNDWIRSGKSFHTIRDHKMHSKPIMGGMWGGTEQLRQHTGASIETLIANYAATAPGGYTDQDFLEKHVWNRVAKDAWQHDIVPSRSYCSQTPGGCHQIPQSIRWDEFFIGSPWKISDDDPNVTRKAATRQYECWSTCTMGPPMDCTCKAKTFKSNQRTFVVPMQGTLT